MVSYSHILQIYTLLPIYCKFAHADPSKTALLTGNHMPLHTYNIICHPFTNHHINTFSLLLQKSLLILPSKYSSHSLSSLLLYSICASSSRPRLSQQSRNWSPLILMLLLIHPWKCTNSFWIIIHSISVLSLKFLSHDSVFKAKLVSI